MLKRILIWILIPLVGIAIQVVFLSDTNNGINGTDSSIYTKIPIPDYAPVTEYEQIVEEPIEKSDDSAPVTTTSAVPVKETYVGKISIGAPLRMIAEGVVTDISYTIYIDGRGFKQKYINFTVGNKKMTLSYDKTNSKGQYYFCEIYNKDGKSGIIPNMLYYIYDWDGDRIVWSQTPKKLSPMGSLRDK